MNKIRFIISIGIKLCFVFIIITFITSCSSDKKKGKASLAVPVTVAAVAQMDIPVQIKAIGNVEAYSTVSVKAQVGGELIRVSFKEGEYMKKGDLLFVIDPRPYEAALRQAEANLAKDTVQAKNAEEQAIRYGQLFEKGYVSREQADQMRTNAGALNAVVKADKAAVENARLQIEYCYIKSPIDGRTGSLMVHQGNIVKANDTTPLVIINKIKPIYVNFSVPEKELAEIKKYVSSGKLMVETMPPNGDMKPSIGELTFIDNAVNTATGTILLKATFPNNDGVLWPGQFINVVLTLTIQPGALIVPSQAVQTGQRGPYVYVIKPDLTAEVRYITVSRTYNSEFVIEKGLKKDEKVVTDGHLQISPGAKVEIKDVNKSKNPEK